MGSAKLQLSFVENSIQTLIVLGAITLVLGLNSASGQSRSDSKQETPSGQRAEKAQSVHKKSRVLIEPGMRVGPLTLGDKWAHTLELFPFTDNVDQKWKDNCGVTFNWVDRPNGVGVGNLFVRLKNQSVFQIE